MIEQALLLFREKLSEYNKDYIENDLNYLVELAKFQLNSSRGFGFCRIHSNDTFLGTELRNVHVRRGTVQRGYIGRNNPGNLDWDQELDFLLLADINNDEDVVMIGYIEGIASNSYSLNPNLLRILLSCFFDDHNNILPPEINIAPKIHKRSYLIPTEDDPTVMTPKSVTPLHSAVLNKLEHGLVNLDALFDNIRLKYLTSDANIKDTAHCLSAIGGLNKILTQGLTETSKQGIYTYPLAYKISGANHPRLVDQLPIQNLPKEIKASIYTDINCVNYDIKSSNMNMLEKLFRDADLDASWFINYLNDPDGSRQKLIEVTGGTKKQVKKALQVVTNGAPFRSTLHTSVGKAFDNVEQGNLFINNLGDLKHCMEKFEEIIEDEGQSKTFKSRGVWKNAVGMTCRFEEGATFGQICSFLVMGLEQKFILTLISKLPDDVKVYTLMHDGFICSKEIQDDLINEVKTECDLPYLLFDLQEGF